MEFEHNRGKINESAVKALVTSALCKSQSHKAKKGKGSYTRKQKFKRQNFE